MLDVTDDIAIADQREPQLLLRLQEFEIRDELAEEIVQRIHARLELGAEDFLALRLALLLVVGAGGFLWFSYTQEQFYIGPHEEYLGIYQGVPEPVFGLPLSRLVQPDATLISDLPEYYQEEVRRTIPAKSLDEARATLVRLQEKAAQCIQVRNSTPTPLPTPAPSLSPTILGPPSSLPSTASPAPTSMASVDC